MDSPGFSAKYCTYTFMEYGSGDILIMVFIDKRSTDLKSTNMEVLGFERALDYLLGEGLKVLEVVTDAQSSIGKLMSKCVSTVHFLLLLIFWYFLTTYVLMI